MSAYIVASAHIDALVAFAVDNRVSFYFGNVRTDITSANAQEIGQTLMRANVASVTHRYSGRLDADEHSAADAYEYQGFEHALKPIEVIKAVHCLEYQSCEHPEWDASRARAITQAMLDKACYALPGYDAAPWGIDSDTPRK